ncbi:nitroreductase/quinone reductase family protein [Cellulomonas fimi]|uniref:nitroreductase/quinone reductase family protein n=1 Tax=Cellulomonas fimi TaxID=1708 RepID=UPI00234D787A|nr:nitroreductase/quinone reductase family protein [Cellulomonas fimi]MDC7122768.1 nitroreductase/quinone reductase family protein [Cellulomonas fimi]
MTTPAPRAVERVRPPAAPFDLWNRSVRWMLSSPRRSRRIGAHLLILHVRGRRTGRVIDVPVAYRPQPDGRLLVLTSSTWRLNLRDRTDVEVTLRGVRRPAAAELVEEPTAVAAVYARLIDEVGPRRAVRQLGVRVNVGRTPTRDELVEAVVRDHLAVVLLRVEDPGS